MAKITAENVNIKINESRREISQLLKRILSRAKTPASREALGGILKQLENSDSVSMREALEIDGMIKNILNNYTIEYLNEDNAEINEGTSKIIAAIVEVRSKMFVSGINSDKRAAWKSYVKQNKLIFTKKEMKDNFRKQFADNLGTLERFKGQVDKLGRVVTKYHLECQRNSQLARVAEIDSEINAISAKFNATRDEAEKSRLEIEYQSKMDSRDAVNANLQILQNHSVNIDGYNDILTNLGILQSVKKIDNLTAEQVTKAAQTLKRELKAETEDNAEIKDSISQARGDRAKAMQEMTNSAGIAKRPTLAQIAQEKMNLQLDGLDDFTATKAKAIEDKISENF